MVIVLGFYRRRPDLTWEEFSAHWRDVHGSLVRDTPDVARYVRRYVQHHLRPRVRPGEAQLQFDGFSEVWYDDIEALQAISRGAGYPVLLSDEREFLDVTASRIVILDEQVLLVGERVRIV